MTSEIDLLIYGELVKLYGFNKEWRDGKTTHLVVFDSSDITMSKKLIHIKNFKHKPHVVNLEWLMDCMEKGEILDEKLEQY